MIPSARKNGKSMPQATKRDQISSQQKAILEGLAKLGSNTVGDDDLVFGADKLMLPAAYGSGVNGAQQAVSFLNGWIRQQQETFSFNRTFPYRPWDGAAAFDRAMRRVFGTSGIGKAIETMFGSQPPAMVSIAVGPKEQLQVPWGLIVFSPLKAEFNLGASKSQEHGLIFSVSVEAPLKFRREIEGFFTIVEEELRERSIYRGKAFKGTTEPIFYDTEAIDPDKVVYCGDVYTQLSTNMWSLLRYSDAMRDNGIPLKRAVLFEGPYGTGKTLAGDLTAKIAVENGWTFILGRPEDDLSDVLRMAQLYAPAVVWFEDLDVVAKGQSEVQISHLLDALDGMTSKGVEVLAGFTTNFAAKIQKGALRPGRLDAVIHIGELDDAGIQKLCRVVIPGDRQGAIDYTSVTLAFEGTMRLPAFVKEAIDRAMRYSIARNEGKLDVIESQDIIDAAYGLRDQVALMEAATEGITVNSLDKALSDVVKIGVGAEVNRTRLYNDYGEIGKLVTAK